VGEQLPSVWVNQLAERLLVAAAGSLQRGLLHALSMPV